MGTRIFIGPSKAVYLGDDVLRRPLFVNDDGVHDGVDISKMVEVSAFTMAPLQGYAIGAQRRESEGA